MTSKEEKKCLSAVTLAANLVTFILFYTIVDSFGPWFMYI